MKQHSERVHVGGWLVGWLCQSNHFHKHPDWECKWTFEKTLPKQCLSKLFSFLPGNVFLLQMAEGEYHRKSDNSHACTTECDLNIWWKNPQPEQSNMLKKKTHPPHPHQIRKIWLYTPSILVLWWAGACAGPEPWPWGDTRPLSPWECPCDDPQLWDCPWADPAVCECPWDCEWDCEWDCPPWEWPCESPPCECPWERELWKAKIPTRLTRRPTTDTVCEQRTGQERSRMVISHVVMHP